MSDWALWRGWLPPKRKEESTHRERARDVGALATLSSFACTNQKKDLYYLHPVVCHDVEKKVNGSIPGSTGTLLGSHSGMAVLRREQLESNQCEN
jgi:hypothetical protein